MADLQKLYEIKAELTPYGASLVAVSKTKPLNEILQVYDSGHRLFGENYVQELSEKKNVLPDDIQWHFIGHLQRNKVKIIAPFVSLIHGVDSERLLNEINRSAAGKTVSCLLQIYIAEEETKFGLNMEEAIAVLEKSSGLPNVKIEGFMGMATNTDNTHQIEKEFRGLENFYQSLKQQYHLRVLSMGMTSDYKIALNCGSNMVRIGSAIFGSR
jgi:PLP dependent protein